MAVRSHDCKPPDLSIETAYQERTTDHSFTTNAVSTSGAWQSGATPVVRSGALRCRLAAAVRFRFLQLPSKRSIYLRCPPRNQALHKVAYLQFMASRVES